MKSGVCTLLSLMICAHAWHSGSYGQELDATATDGNTPRAFELMAHRGGMGEVSPANSLPGFERALDLRVDTLEMDARLTKDNTIVVIHDEQLKWPWHTQSRDDGNGQTNGRIRDMAMEEVNAYRHPVRPPPRQLPDGYASGIHVGKSKYAGVPRLEEVFRFVREYAQSELKSCEQRHHAEKVRFCIEMKHPGFEEAIVQLVKEQCLVNRVTIQSFDFNSLEHVSELCPELSTMALSFLPVEPNEIAERTGADYWGPYFGFLTAAKTKAAQELGLRVTPWTVNGKSAITKALSWGVDGIMTDYPSAARELLLGKGVRRLSDSCKRDAPGGERTSGRR